jgi:hypothetical protein
MSAFFADHVRVKTTSPLVSLSIRWTTHPVDDAEGRRGPAPALPLALLEAGEGGTDALVERHLVTGARAPRDRRPHPLGVVRDRADAGRLLDHDEVRVDVDEGPLREIVRAGRPSGGIEHDLGPAADLCPLVRHGRAVYGHLPAADERPRVAPGEGREELPHDPVEGRTRQLLRHIGLPHFVLGSRT